MRNLASSLEEFSKSLEERASEAIKEFHEAVDSIDRQIEESRETFRRELIELERKIEHFRGKIDLSQINAMIATARKLSRPRGEMVSLEGKRDELSGLRAAIALIEVAKTIMRNRELIFRMRKLVDIGFSEIPEREFI